MNYPLKNKPLLLLFLLLGLFSCEEGDKTPAESQSKLSAEQQKVQLDQEGVNFIGHLEDLEKPDLIDPLTYFIEISENINEDQFNLSAKVGHSFLKSAKLLTGNSLKSALIGDDHSFKRIMNDNQGIYTYSRTNESWTKTAATGKVEFVFPSNESTTTNNASFVFSNLTTLTVSNTDIYEDVVDLPKTLDIDFKVDNIVKCGYYLSNEYNIDNIPTMEKSTLVLGSFKLVEEYSLTNEKVVSMKSTMSSNDNVFVTLGATSDGDFSNDILSADEIQEEDVINTINAYVQIENVKVTGNINFKNLATKVKEIETKYEMQRNDQNGQYPKAYYEELVALFSSNGSLNMRFADKNEIFAKLTPYVSTEDDYYWEYNPTTYSYESIEYKRNDVDFKVEFTDGSKLDDSYFDSGFSAFVNKLNSIINRINNDYDESINEIDY